MHRSHTNTPLWLAPSVTTGIRVGVRQSRHSLTTDMTCTKRAPETRWLAARLSSARLGSKPPAFAASAMRLALPRAALTRPRFSTAYVMVDDDDARQELVARAR